MKNKLKNIKDVFTLFLFVLLCCNSIVAQQTGYEDSSESDYNNDPFAQFNIETNPYVEEVVPQIIQVQESEPNLFIETVVLKFLDAKSILQIVERMNSEYGQVSINEKNNSLIVCDTKEHLERILQEIRKADKTPEQIMIEVVIVDVQLDDDTEIGVNWDLLTSDRSNVEYRHNFSSSRIGTTIEDTTTIANGTAFNTTGLGGAFSVISSSVRHVLQMLQQKRKVKILASPRVMMVSGSDASIEAVEEIPYTEISDTAAGGAGAITTTNFKNVGIQLMVSAIITDSNNIFLTVSTEQNVTSGQSDTEVPIVDTRRATTSLLLKDSQTIIFGGLRRQEKTKEINQIPILGDLPLIGFFFKNTNTVINNSELIVFLSPHIYKNETLSEEETEVFKEITEKPMLSIKEL